MWNFLVGVWRVILGKWFKNCRYCTASVFRHPSMAWEELTGWQWTPLLLCTQDQHRRYGVWMPEQGRSSGVDRGYFSPPIYLQPSPPKVKLQWTSFKSPNYVVRQLEARMNPHAVSVNLETKKSFLWLLFPVRVWCPFIGDCASALF